MIARLKQNDAMLIIREVAPSGAAAITIDFKIDGRISKICTMMRLP